MNIIFLGPPGCGKGTQAQRLAKEFNFKIISTGDIIRETIERDEYPEIKKYVEKGELVPDDIVVELIEKRIKNNSSFILDGFPRTIKQAKMLEKITNIDKVIYFDCDEEIIIKRLASRRICPKCNKVYNLITQPPKEDNLCDLCKEKLKQREDDKKKTIRKRFQVYKKETSPIIEFYKSKFLLKKINANLTIDEIYSKIKNIING